MLRKIYLSVVAVMLLSTAVFAQTSNGGIKVTVKDKSNGEAIPFANIVAFQNGIQVGVGTTNMEGEAVIKPLSPGKYDVKAVYVGYEGKEIKGVVVGEGKIAYLTMDLATGAGVNLEGVEVVDYQEPLVDPDTKSGGTITREEYQNMATKSINSVAATTAGVYQSDEGGALNVRGGRDYNTVYFVDGVKVIGGLGLPQQGVEQINVITGGLPAMYGDATSGIISVTTRGPQQKFFGGVELISSQLTDAYGYNSLGFSVGGPIWSKRDSTGNKTPVLGFFLSGQGTYQKDPNPSYVDLYKVKDDVLQRYEQTPLRPTPSGSGFNRNLEYLNPNDVETIKTHQNAASRAISLNGKIDYKPTNSLNITVGGALDYTNAHSAVYSYMLFNPQNNPQTIGTTWRVYGRATQRFNTKTADQKEKTQSAITDAFFTFLASYERATSVTQDDTHKDRFFDYGYIGKFKEQFLDTNFVGNYAFADSAKMPDGTYQHNVYTYRGRTQTGTTFEAGSLNQTSVNYTQYVFDYFGGNMPSLNTLAGLGGLRNGDSPQSIYSMWSATGTQYGGYSKSETDQFRIASSFSADFKKHNIQVGVEYDQRNYSAYSLAPTALWTRMRQIVNTHIEQLDTANPILNTQLTGNGPYPYVYYNQLYNPASQTQFSRSLLEKLGLPQDYNKFIQVDQLDPNMLSIDMFSADDLYGSGGSASSLVGYYGFDHTGKRDKTNYSLEDWYTLKDANGNFVRGINAFRPIYVSGYIQDRFDFKDVKFNVGVRVDRYDANQKMLKDKYLFHEAKTANEVTNLGSHPGNIGSDYVVYVDDYNDPKSIVGYRDGDKWYDAKGAEVSDPNALATSTGRVAPYLKNPSQFTSATPFSASAFKDYVPQINVMPRIAFSFPISDVANFFAHYDVLTQRPASGANRFNTTDYYFILTDNFVNNAALKPERTTDYELGFTQILNEKKNAALKITSFYREMRNQIQVKQINQAFPRTYLTYDNIDFGTVKGFTFEFDLRRTNGVSLTANYTLQFAEGSGSNASSGANLASSGQPNLRVTMPLDYDQRHRFVVNLDYRFGEGKDYRGPEFKTKKDGAEKTHQILKNVGANLIFNLGSGTPYTRYSTAVPIGGGRSNIDGLLNGSSKPWQFRADFRIDKNVELTWGKKDSDSRKTANLTVYLQVLNLLNTRNILNVYNYTGDPTDDGYLQSPLAQAQLKNALSPQTYTTLYNIYLNNPNNFARPRTIRIGLMLDF